ncbi:MAG: Rrf2 family transcriptional regulator [Gemmataceae bacterium]|nr:Rrf2 family transcriptional regulator [Gemmataceae bacterium]
MFSQTVEYALRAVVFLAKTAPASSICAEIAAATKVPRPYMAKVLQSLVKGGVLRSQRGVGGGISMRIPPADLTLFTVVNAVEPFKRIKHCPLELVSHGVKLCSLHSRVDKALEMVEQAFAATTLAEILAEPASSVPLCDFPPKKKALPQV